jgi:hypothetical protein
MVKKNWDEMLYVASSTRQKDEQAMRANRKILNVKTY